MMAFLVRFCVFSVCALTLASALFAQPQAARAADVSVIIDQARLLKLPDRASTVVVGNPSIADASVQSGGWMILTGKGYGLTNVVALDRAGVVLMEKTVEVQGPQSVVTVHKGVSRETLSCTPECERRLTLGDGSTHFDAANAQTQARNALAIGSATAR
jgi:Flp pilus assembly secretin CpaC